MRLMLALECSALGDGLVVQDDERDRVSEASAEREFESVALRACMLMELDRVATLLTDGVNVPREKELLGTR